MSCTGLDVTPIFLPISASPLAVRRCRKCSEMLYASSMSIPATRSVSGASVRRARSASKSSSPSATIRVCGSAIASVVPQKIDHGPIEHLAMLDHHPVTAVRYRDHAQVRHALGELQDAGLRHPLLVDAPESKRWTFELGQIGRASCRERVWQYV